MDLNSLALANCEAQESRTSPEAVSYTHLEELAEFSLSTLLENQSVLIICNKKDQARILYQQVSHANAKVFHLSTSMCMEHRIQVLEQIKKALGKEPVICVATQLVEAGVDFSFGCVIRLIAGMDSIIQAAGRCNRNGEFARLCPVYIVNPQNENLGQLKEIREAQTATEELLASFAKSSERFANDLQSNQAIQ